MQDLNKISDEVLREMIKLNNQVENARQINYEENELKRSTLQKMVHKFRFEIGENKVEVEDYIKINLPEARNSIKGKIRSFLSQFQEQCTIILKAAKAKKKTLKHLVKPLRETLKTHEKSIKEAHLKYRKYFRNRNWRKRLKKQTPEQRAERNVSIVLGIVALTIIELLLLIMGKYVDNQVPTLLAIGFGAVIGGMVLYIVILALLPQLHKVLVKKEVKLLEKVREEIEMEGLTATELKQQGRKIKNDLINVRVALERDRHSES